MKDFRQHLKETEKVYCFRIKIAGEVSDDHMEMLERVFQKYQIIELKKPKVTPIQKTPYDFPLLTNSEVSIMEFSCEYPTTPGELVVDLKTCLDIPESHIRVTTLLDDDAIQQEVDQEAPEDAPYEVLLGADYKPSTAKHEYGDEYNKAMLATVKTREYEFAKKTKANGKTTNEVNPGKPVSPIGSLKVKR